MVFPSELYTFNKLDIISVNVLCDIIWKSNVKREEEEAEQTTNRYYKQITHEEKKIHYVLYTHNRSGIKAMWSSEISY